jgi:hypothetical protein
LERTELAAVGVGIDDQGGSVGVDDGSERGLILAGDYEDFVDVVEQEADGSGEECFSGGTGGLRRPREQGFVAAHARRFAGG